MRFACVSLLLASVARSSLLASAAAEEHRVNGWYPCSFSYENRDDDEGVDVGGSTFDLSDFENAFECAVFEMPLCFPGICESDQKIHVFAKRLPAANSEKIDDECTKVLWLLNGGPGASSANLEEWMAAAQEDLDGDVAVYTLDLRGTGRSHYLQCDAAQVFMDGSPSGTTVTADELPTCLKDLSFQYENEVAAWSVTSAAMDLKEIINTLHGDANKHEVYINGFSYGSFLLQRLVQIGSPASITGLIFEGVDVLSTKNDTIESAFSHDDVSRIAPSRRLLEFCFDDALCPLTFKSRDTVIEEVLALYDKLDEHKDASACSQLLVEIGIYVNPSDNLRDLLWWRAQHLTEREFIPLILAKLQSCETEDVEYLRAMLDPYSLMIEGSDSEDGSSDDARRLHRRARQLRSWSLDDEPDVLDPVGYSNTLLFDLIVASERWAEPFPTVDELKSFYRGGPFSQPNPLVAELQDVYQNLSGDDQIPLGLAATVCVFQNASGSVCDAVQDRLPPDALPFVYPRDKYYDAPMLVANTTTVMLFNGDLDFQTPTEFGDLLWEKLIGARDKLAVDFHFGTHCRGEATASSTSKRCRDTLVTQLITSSGDVSRIDTSCLFDLPEIAFPTEYTPLHPSLSNE